MHPDFRKKPKECKILGCTNKSNQGTFVGDFCLPCYIFITKGEGKYSQAYRNALSTKKEE